jgi:hypothetical protein
MIAAIRVKLVQHAFTGYLIPILIAARTSGRPLSESAHQLSLLIIHI